MKAKRVLLRHLGLIESDDAPISSDLLNKYARIFERPLAEDMIEAFADFYGWQVPSFSTAGVGSAQAQPCLIKA